MTAPFTESLVFAFHQVRDEGSRIVFRESLRDLTPPEDDGDELKGPSFFDQEIRGELMAFKVASKLHVKGRFETEIHPPCDRCGDRIALPVSGEFEFFLLPDKLKGDFSDELEEDSHFSHFDGIRVDLRPLLREAVLLEIPIRFVDLKPNGDCRVCGKSLQDLLDAQNPDFEVAQTSKNSSLAKALEGRGPTQDPKKTR